MMLLRVSLVAMSSALTLLVTGCSFWIPSKEKQMHVDLETPTVSYHTFFPKNIERSLRDALKKASILRRLEPRPPLTLFALEKRAEKDVVEMYETLETHGYFEGTVTVSTKILGKDDAIEAYLDEEERAKIEKEKLKEETSHKPAHLLSTTAQNYAVFFKINPGVQYTLKAFTVRYDGGLPPHTLDMGDDLPLRPGMPVNLEKAMEFSKKIAKYWRTQGYPFAKAKTMEGDLDKNTKTLSLTFVIKLGPQKAFGPTWIRGFETLSETFLRNRLEYIHHQPYDERLVERTRKSLMETGLFNDVTFQPVDEDGYGRDNKKFLLLSTHGKKQSQEKSDIPPEPKKEKNDTSPKEEHARLILASKDVPMHLRIKEGPPRRIGGGIKYETSYGTSGRAFWRHDNAFGGGESIEARVTAGKRKNEARLALSLPDCIVSKQTFLSSLSFSEEYTRAFKDKSSTITAGFSYDLTPLLQINYGLQQEIGRIKRNNTASHLRFTSLPVIMDYDGTDSLLNPTKGWRVRAKSTPFIGKYETTRFFWAHEGFMSTYLHPPKKVFEETDNIFVFAPWAKVGMLSSSSHSLKIPPSKRFYSGGGNSVRGYGFQMLGPMDSTGTPIGGASVLEFGSECRFALSEKVGAAFFAEAGSINLRKTPSIRGKNLLWGVGAGLRYFTMVAPIRIDLALPTKRRRYPGSTSRKKIDSAFQFYISVGQAF